MAEHVVPGDVVGLFQGRMEFGPRALGHRSIIGDPRSPEMQSVLNLKIKYRESFRPFAPAVLEERVADYFDHKGPSPYMLIVADVSEERWVPAEDPPEDLRDWVNQARSDLPAITHLVAGREERFLVFCDDLTFHGAEDGYIALKVALDGSISTTADNMLIYATSNRRHLMPEQ